MATTVRPCLDTTGEEITIITALSVGRVMMHCPAGAELAVFQDGRLIRAGHPKSCKCMTSPGPTEGSPAPRRKGADGTMSAPPGFRDKVAAVSTVISPTLARDEHACPPAPANQEDPAPRELPEISERRRLGLMLKAVEGIGDHILIAQLKAQLAALDPEEGPVEDAPQEPLCAPVEDEQPEVDQPPQVGDKWPQAATQRLTEAHPPARRKRRSPIRSLATVAAVAMVAASMVQVLVTSGSVTNTS